MSNIAELANCPELSFIESMTLQETEEQLRELYTKYYREATGKEPEIGEADPLNLLIKAFCAMEYQTMQYADAKGRMEMLKTSTGDALDALAALVGLTRKEANRATATVRFTLSEAQSGATAIPTGTRVKSEDGKYFNTVEYGEIAAGETYTDVVVQAEEAGAESSGIAAGEIDTLVDPIPYVASVESIEASTGGLDIEDDDGLTERVWLAPSKYSCAGPRDAYAYYVKEWRTDVDDVQIVSPEPCVVHVYVVMDGGVLPTETEREELAAYLNGDTIRPLTDIVSCPAAEEVPYDISLTYWIASNDQKSAGTIQAQVEAAVDAYESWQRKMGRDINPTELVYRVRAAGAKRVKLAAPADIVIEKTQLPKRNTRTVTYGGLEDD